jgi:hypothetical protein
MPRSAPRHDRDAGGPPDVLAGLSPVDLVEAGTIPLTSHDVLVDLIVTADRVIDCRPRHGPRPAAGIRWEDLTPEKIAAIPLLAAQNEARRRLAGGSHGGDPDHEH